MRTAYDPGDIVFPSEGAAGTIEATLIFRRRTIWAVHITAIAVGVGLYGWGMFNRTALLTPPAPGFRAFMIGLGVFLGVLLAAVEREAWLLGIGVGRRAPPRGIRVVIAMLVLVGASGFGGDFLATRLWEWHAFHGLRPAAVDEDFLVTARHSSRHGASLELRLAPDGPPFDIGCSTATYQAVKVGERLRLPVETGRSGVQRVTLPPTAKPPWDSARQLP